MMNRKTFETMFMVGGLLVLGVLGLAVWGVLVVILVAYLILHYAIPGRHTPHLATLEVLLVAGGLVGLLLLVVFRVPHPWLLPAGAVWLAVSAGVSMFRPFGFLIKAEDKNSIWPIAPHKGPESEG